MEIKDKSILVTGGAGAIGSRLVRILLEKQAKHIFVIDDLSSGFEWLLPNDNRVTFKKMDVVDIETASLPVDGNITYCFHLAGFFANQNSVEHPEKDLHTNGLGTLKTLKWCAENNVNRLVYASAGCSIAGHDIHGPIREDMPVTLHMNTPYQITKALGEFYCNYYNEKVSTVRCRFFNSYGPGEVPGFYRNVIPNFVWWGLNNEPITITGTGKESRDFIYVNDLCEALTLCAITPDANGEAFNLGTGIETDVQTLANLVIELTNSKSELVYKPRRSWDKSLRRQADTSKAKRILGFDAKVSFREGMEQTVKWFMENREQIASAITEYR